jgi:hypothetical protein
MLDAPEDWGVARSRAPVTEEQRRADHERERARGIVEEEVRAGLRDATTGQRFGLTTKHRPGEMDGLARARLADAEAPERPRTSELERLREMLSGEEGSRGPGNAALGARGDMSSSTADRLAAKKMREDAFRRQQGVIMTDDLVRDALTTGDASRTSRGGAIGDAGASWRQRMQARRMEQALKEQGGAITLESLTKGSSHRREDDADEHEDDDHSSGRQRMQRHHRHRHGRGDDDDNRGSSSRRRHRDRHDRGDDDDNRDRSRRRGHRHHRDEDRRTTERRVDDDRAPRFAKPGERESEEVSEPRIPAGLATVAPSDANRLAAAALKAEMRGQAERGALLRQAERDAREGRPIAEALVTELGLQAATAGPVQVEEGRVLKVVSGLGRDNRPLESLHGEERAAVEREDLRMRDKGKRRLKGVERDSEGQVVGYGAADSASLAELVRRERLGGESQDELLASNILRMGHKFKGGALSGSRAGADEEEELDMRLVRTEEDRLTHQARRERDLQRAAAADSRAERMEASDPLNPESSKFLQHLLVAAGKHWVLLASPGKPLAAGHCVLVPIEPLESVAAAEEDAYAEYNEWCTALNTLFSVAPSPPDPDWEAEPPVFCETVLDPRPGRGRRTRVEVIPVGEEEAMSTPVYFHKALSEVEDMMQSRAVISTAGKGLKRCVPVGFPYAHVGWAGGGYVHPIEHPETFPRDMLLDVVAGILGADPSRFGRKEASRGVGEGLAAAQQLARRLLSLPSTSVIDWAQSRALDAAVCSVQQSSSVTASAE